MRAMSKELDLAELGLAFLVCLAALAIYVIVALSPATAQSQGSCWQCMHGCFGRDAEICGKSGHLEPGPEPATPEISTKGLRDAIAQRGASSSYEEVELWNNILTELRKLEDAIQSRQKR